MGKRIAIRFCGGCNPRIDRGQVAQEIQSMCDQLHDEVVYGHQNADIVVYISGCTSGCAKKYVSSVDTSVTVAALTVDGCPVSRHDLIPEISVKLLQLLKTSES